MGGGSVALFLLIFPSFKFYEPIEAVKLYVSLMNCPLTLSWRRPLSYRNQSMDLLCKSVDWFLYDHGPRHERVNYCKFWYHINKYAFLINALLADVLCNIDVILFNLIINIGGTIVEHFFVVPQNVLWRPFRPS